MYGISFVCCKLATAFFVLLGHVPSWVGCDAEVHVFNGSRDMHPSIQCSVCYPDNIPYSELCAGTTDFHYTCNTTCTKLFFSGAGSTAVSLDVFVLMPLAWLPFAVYSNNEVARMIDGLWQQHTNDIRGNSQSIVSSGRLGLSNTAHGYNAVAPLVHAATLICSATLILFLSKSHGGYFVGAPEGLEKIQRSLTHAGILVTATTIVLNVLMCLRFVYEMFSNAAATMRRSASAIEQELLTTDTMRISSPEFHALSAEEQLKLLPPVRSGELS